VTDYETWINHYQLEKKQASMQWKHKHSSMPTKFNVVPQKELFYWEDNRDWVMINITLLLLKLCCVIMYR